MKEPDKQIGQNIVISTIRGAIILRNLLSLFLSNLLIFCVILLGVNFSYGLKFIRIYPILKLLGIFSFLNLLKSFEFTGILRFFRK